MKRWIVSVVVAVQPFVLGLLVGADYTKPGFDLAWSYVLAMFWFYVAAFVVDWKKK